ncbi:MAG: hypothetical protein Q8P05_05705 [Candidatus Diapherotrites archaeon]|nr:hypothetical protein [Candidatus Diapherotrites archaeon]
MNDTLPTRFEMAKRHHLHTLEKAIAEGKIDNRMIPFSKMMAGNKDYFTTSTCSGRITLMDLDTEERKREGAFYRKWHSTVKPHEVWEAIEAYEGEKNLWLKQDGFVMVIGTHSLEKAKKIFKVCQEAGIKRFGIHHIEEGKILMEVYGTTQMSMPIVIDGKKDVDKNYVSKVVALANIKWKRNEQRRKHFEKTLRKYLS